jgi:hypothetical protein
MWKNSSWVLHLDNALAHNAPSVKRFLTKHKIAMLEQPPYSPNLAPCDSLPQDQVCVKGTRFESVDAVKAKAVELKNKVSEDDLQHCFQKWKIRMEWCRDQGGEYVEGDISIV